jgi:hypothetical protein
MCSPRFVIFQEVLKRTSPEIKGKIDAIKMLYAEIKKRGRSTIRTWNISSDIEPWNSACTLFSAETSSPVGTPTNTFPSATPAIETFVF